MSTLFPLLGKKSKKGVQKLRNVNGGTFESVVKGF